MAGFSGPPHFPEFATQNQPGLNSEWRKRVTIEHLLTHTGGLTSWKPFYKQVQTHKQLVDAVCATPLEAEPGTRYCYSDLGFILLGELASRAGKKPLSELEQQHVFTPLAMNRTTRKLGNQQSQAAPTEYSTATQSYWRGIVHDENARAGNGETGHAGLFSTIEDVSQFGAELLLALRGESRHFPKPIVLNFTRRRGVIPELNRGLGWGHATGKNVAIGLSESAFGHTGFTGTSFWVDPEKNLFFILLSNRVHPTRKNYKISQVRRDFTSAVIADWKKSNESESTK